MADEEQNLSVPRAVEAHRADANALALLLAALVDARNQLEAYETDATGEVYNDIAINFAIAKGREAMSAIAQATGEGR